MNRIRKRSFPALLSALAPLGFLAVLTLAWACSRLAGTETGNPEVIVSARFSVRNPDSGLAIPGMNLTLTGMDWKSPDHEQAIWDKPEGYRIDFASDDLAQIPSVAMGDGEWIRSEMTLQAPDCGSTFPDSAVFEDWNDPCYIKLVKSMSQDTLRVLFGLEAGTRIRLGFTSATIGKWRSKGKLEVAVIFNTSKWADGLDLGPGLDYREDGNHIRYIVVSPLENPSAYAAMKIRFPDGFLADSASMH